MEAEKDLPPEQSRFCKHPKDETWAKAFLMNIVLPYAWYLVWALGYYLINFVIKRKQIREKEYGTLYRYFQKIQWSSKILKKAGPRLAPLVFMLYHCAFFSISHIFALCAYYSKIAHTFLMFFWLFICVWNGSAYYVKFFQYTQKLSTQQMLNKQVANSQKLSSKLEQSTTDESKGNSTDEKQDT